MRDFSGQLHVLTAEMSTVQTCERSNGQTTTSAKWGNIVLLLALLCSMPVSLYLPLEWGWENGPVENAQVLVLLAGLVAALWGTGRHSHPTRMLWWVASLFWLVMAGRELAWGAAFLPEVGFDPLTGPTITSKILWYRPAVPWVIGAMLAWVIYAVVRYRLVTRVVWPWLRDRQVPWASLGLFVLAMLVSAHAEGHALMALPLPPERAAMVMEEVAELWAYAALFWAQWQLVSSRDAQAAAV